VIIATLNVKFSPNLGDGLLAECLEAELRANGDDVRTVAIDLAGRKSYGEGGVRHRRAVMAMLDGAPKPLRRAAVGSILGWTVNRRLRPSWAAIMRAADAVVLGGGNLLADADLNFPLKVAGALGEASAAGLPIGVYGVGVSDNWSARGRSLFQSAFREADLVHSAVRDERSRRLWDRDLTSVGAPKADLCRDPAVLVARHFPPTPRADRTSPHVGLGLTDPLALRYHAQRGADEEAMTAWLAELVRQIDGLGWRVRLFTNGSPEDVAYARRAWPRLAAAAKAQTLEPAVTFDRPAELAAFISGLDLVLAHRMHACICAYAYGLPHVGFAWDVKLQSFFQSVGRGDYMVDPQRSAPAAAAALAVRALSEGLDRTAHAACLADARSDIARLYRALSAARDARRTGAAP
jgi:polysaccharide pyruvyl transferase WcaK-like protein